MPILTIAEKEFLDVFLHEVTTEPFTGPATKAIHAIGVEIKDISYLSWAYDREVPRTSWEWGYAAEVAPPLPWADREAVLRRDKEVERIWHQQREPAGALKES